MAMGTFNTWPQAPWMAAIKNSAKLWLNIELENELHQGLYF